MAVSFYTQSRKEIAPIWIRIREGSIDAKASINQISSSNNETLWSIEGDFSGTYSYNNTGETVSLTGSYRSVIATYQD